METKLPLQPSGWSQYILVHVHWLGEVKERFHHCSIWVGRVQCNQPSIFHQYEMKMRRTFDVKAVCGYAMGR